MVSHEVKVDVGLFFTKARCRILVKKCSLKRISIIPLEPRSEGTLGNLVIKQSFRLQLLLFQIFSKITGFLRKLLVRCIEDLQRISLIVAVSIVKWTINIKQEGRLVQSLRKSSGLICGFCKYLLGQVVLKKNRFALVKTSMMLFVNIDNLLS